MKMKIAIVAIVETTASPKATDFQQMWFRESMNFINQTFLWPIKFDGFVYSNVSNSHIENSKKLLISLWIEREEKRKKNSQNISTGICLNLYQASRYETHIKDLVNEAKPKQKNVNDSNWCIVKKRWKTSSLIFIIPIFCWMNFTTLITAFFFQTQEIPWMKFLSLQ